MLTISYSFVECNLLVMCCCLPTLRRFLRHVAPGLIGEDLTEPSTPSGAVRTFGSAETKPAHDTLMCTLNDAETNGDIMLDPMDGKKKEGRRDPKVKITSMKGDAESEEAILFERTVHVACSSPEDASERGQMHVGRIWAGELPNEDV
jgi:hypothetical protein